MALGKVELDCILLYVVSLISKSYLQSVSVGWTSFVAGSVGYNLCLKRIVDLMLLIVMRVS